MTWSIVIDPCVSYFGDMTFGFYSSSSNCLRFTSTTLIIEQLAGRLLSLRKLGLQCALHSAGDDIRLATGRRTLKLLLHCLRIHFDCLPQISRVRMCAHFRLTAHDFSFLSLVSK